MNLLWLLLVALFIQCSFVSSCPTWKQRMQMYGALANCEYYITSESEYKDYFDLDDIAEKKDNKTRQVRFFTISQNKIEVKLSFDDASDLIQSSPSSRYRRQAENNENDYADDYDSDHDSDHNSDHDSDKEVIQDNVELSDQNQSAPSKIQNTFELVIGAHDGQYIESYISENGLRKKTLTTSGILHANQPNDILIEFLSGNKLRATINGNTFIEIKASNLDGLKYISFKSHLNRNMEEFFYNCH